MNTGQGGYGRRVLSYVVLATAVATLASCAAGPGLADPGPDPAGFWLGLWHGLISPITFIIGLFTSSVSIYEVHNNGNWYDFGFMIGVSTVFSGGITGGGRARRARRRKATD